MEIPARMKSEATILEKFRHVFENQDCHKYKSTIIKLVSNVFLNI